MQKDEYNYNCRTETVTVFSAACPDVNGRKNGFPDGFSELIKRKALKREEKILYAANFAAKGNPPH